jgi:hypothetical protein
MSMGPEVKAINWKQARGALYRWPQVMRESLNRATIVGSFTDTTTAMLINMCQQITGAALSAYLPTLLSENGFKGATAQIATLAPYGSAAVCMIIAAKVSDRFGNRGWPTQFGWLLLIIGFAIFLGAPTSNKPAHFVALILAETGHYSKCSSTFMWNMLLTVSTSLHSTDRDLVGQQCRQRVSTCRCCTPCRRSCTGRRVSGFFFFFFCVRSWLTVTQYRLWISLPCF